MGKIKQRIVNFLNKPTKENYSKKKFKNWEGTEQSVVWIKFLICSSLVLGEQLDAALETKAAALAARRLNLLKCSFWFV